MDLSTIDAAIEDSLTPIQEETETLESEEVPESEVEEESSEESDEGEGDGEKDEKGETDDDSEGEEDESGEDGEKETGSEEKDTGESDPKKKKPRRNRYQERLDTLTRERYEAQARIEELEDQLFNKPPELPPQPNPTAFRDQQGNVDQRALDFATGKWQAEVDRINQEFAQREQRKMLKERERYHQKISKEKSIYGDYQTALRNLDDLPMTPELHTALLHDENATDLFCFLGSNRRIAEDVLKLRGHQQSLKLAEISQKLQAAKNRPKLKKSSNPPPTGKPKKGTVGKSGGTTKKFDDLSFEEHCKQMQKAEERKRMAFVT